MGFFIGGRRKLAISRGFAPRSFPFASYRTSISSLYTTQVATLGLERSLTFLSTLAFRVINELTRINSYLDLFFLTAWPDCTISVCFLDGLRDHQLMNSAMSDSVKTKNLVMTTLRNYASNSIQFNFVLLQMKWEAGTKSCMCSLTRDPAPYIWQQ